MGYADLIGAAKVILDGSKPALRPCKCGSTTGFETGPVGPHYNGVRCNECHRHLGWLPDDRSDDFNLIED